MNKPHPILDTHAHLIELKKKSPDQFLAFSKLFDPREDFILDVGINLNDTDDRRTLHKELGIKHWSLGLYPSIALGKWQDEIIRLRDQVKTYMADPASGLCALGEVGIDGSKPYGPDQVPLLVAQIAVANEFDLPIIVHSRAAAQQCLEVFKNHPPQRAGIMHCYSEEPDLVESFVNLGFYISFAGNISYKKSAVIVEAMNRVPLHRLLVETDSPYLSPEPDRSQINTPLGSIIVAELIAQLRSMPINELLAQLKENVQTLFRLKGNA